MACGTNGPEARTAQACGAGHKAAEEIKLENAEVVSPFPYHPGAIKYYKEKGLKMSF
jgi:TRAP-type uncharacterized transport system substrate-binding protein